MAKKGKKATKKKDMFDENVCICAVDTQTVISSLNNYNHELQGQVKQYRKALDEEKHLNAAWKAEAKKITDAVRYLDKIVFDLNFIKGSLTGINQTVQVDLQELINNIDQKITRIGDLQQGIFGTLPFNADYYQ